MATFTTAVATLVAATAAAGAWAQCSGGFQTFAARCVEDHAHWDRESLPVSVVVPVPSAKMTAVQGEQEVTTLRVPSSKMHGDDRAAEVRGALRGAPVSAAGAP
jgi:hypothetical protein